MEHEQSEEASSVGKRCDTSDLQADEAARDWLAPSSPLRDACLRLQRRTLPGRRRA